MTKNPDLPPDSIDVLGDRLTAAVTRDLERARSRRRMASAVAGGVAVVLVVIGAGVVTPRTDSVGPLPGVGDSAAVAFEAGLEETASAQSGIVRVDVDVTGGSRLWGIPGLDDFSFQWEDTFTPDGLRNEITESSLDFLAVGTARIATAEGTFARPALCGENEWSLSPGQHGLANFTGAQILANSSVIGFAELLAADSVTPQGVDSIGGDEMHRFEVRLDLGSADTEIEGTAFTVWRGALRNQFTRTTLASVPATVWVSEAGVRRIVVEITEDDTEVAAQLDFLSMHDASLGLDVPSGAVGRC